LIFASLLSKLGLNVLLVVSFGDNENFELYSFLLINKRKKKKKVRERKKDRKR